MSLSPPWTGQSLILEERDVGSDAWVQGCFHHLLTEGNWGWEVPHRSDTALAGSAPSASHVGCTLKLWREFAATQMCMEAPGCNWVSFSGCSRWGKEGASSSLYTGLFLCKPRSCTCMKERTEAVLGSTPKSAQWIPHWNEVMDVFSVLSALQPKCGTRWGLKMPTSPPEVSADTAHFLSDRAGPLLLPCLEHGLAKASV